MNIVWINYEAEKEEMLPPKPNTIEEVQALIQSLNEKWRRQELIKSQQQNLKLLTSNDS